MRKLAGSKRALGIEYAIRDVVIPAKELEKKGIKVLKLNIGDPNKFDFDAPEHMKEAFCKAIKEGHNYYSDSVGIQEVREAIAEKERRNGAKVSPEDIFITVGTSEAIQVLTGALTDPGEEILVPSPTYPPYIGIPKYLGTNPVEYFTIEEEGWIPDPDDIRKKINEKTRGIVIINPNNPTGALYPEKAIREIVDIAGEYEIPVISDEIYNQLLYEGNFVSPAKVSKDVPVIVLNGLSKVYFATGWRFGYIAVSDPEGKLGDLKEAIAKLLRIRVSSNTPVQFAALAAFTGSMRYLEDYLKKLKRRRDLTYSMLSDMEGISLVKPKGAFYVFPKVEIERGPWKDDKEFVLDFLHEEHVLLVHGSGFGECGKGHFRAVFLPPEEILEEAFSRLERFLQRKLK